MSVIDRLLLRLRKPVVDEGAESRSEQIIERVDTQWPEVRRHGAFARLVMDENHLAPKIRSAIREG